MRPWEAPCVRCRRRKSVPHAGRGWHIYEAGHSVAVEPSPPDGRLMMERDAARVIDDEPGEVGDVSENKGESADHGAGSAQSSTP